MASNKLSWQELRKAVAEYAHCSEQEADTFLSALLDSIVKGLTKDKQVKIKGLGVFSLKPVAPRKSVNIATGEDFTIEGYNKLTFSAESTLKESVEKRIEKPVTEEAINAILNDPLKKLGEQANEIVDLLADLGQTPENKEVTKKSKKATKKSTSAVKPKEPAVKKVVEQPKTTKPATTTIAPVKAHKKCNCKWVFWVISTTILAGAIGTGIYFQEQMIGWWQCTKFMEKSITKSQYHDIITSKQIQRIAIEEQQINDTGFENTRKQVADWWKKVKSGNKVIKKEQVEVVSTNTNEETQPTREQTIPPLNTNYQELNYNRAPGIQPLQPVRRENIKEVVTEEIVVEVVTEEVLEEVIEEVVANPSIDENIVEKKTVVALADQQRVYTKFIGTEVVNQDSRLTLIAYKYYGNKDLWVFIYEANRDAITHPARVTPGQELHIPELGQEYLDLNNTELRQLVDSLTIEYLK